MKGSRGWGSGFSKIIASFFTLLVLLYPIPYTLYPVHAQADDIGQTRINPASPLYFLVSVREILELKFARTTYDKALLELRFTTNRLSEVKSLAQSSRQDLIVPTLEVYWSQLQELSNIANIKDEKKAGEINDKTIDKIIKDMAFLQGIYSQVPEPSARRSIRNTINRLSQLDQSLADKLNLAKQPALAQKMMTTKLTGCSFLSQVASSSALNEVEKAVLEERAQKCLTIKP